MKTLVVFRHVPFEDLGTLGDTLHECGFQYHYIDTPITSLATFNPLHADVLIVLGGPISANDETGYPFLSQELEIIRQWLAQQRSVLGICLGAQLMARALGARVAPMGGERYWLWAHPIVVSVVSLCVGSAIGCSCVALARRSL
ncbi:hypothetical protein [Candidatus Symbiopectobacterium sp. 'North America']|uniref:glutamine amidotransferase-related protein n=1 Tax=Candidatus Symbiopectobacterium sp. 'North America' TaxID=2794574 RepID=UPI001FD4E509|nr:hypothetical protein [Candidatus Symbiopectobacterium sp. 'North America']